MKLLSLFLLFITTIISTQVSAGNICSDKKLNKITICHAGSEHNPHFVNICVDFAAVHGHLKNHSHDSVGACGSTTQSLNDGVVYACNAGIKHIKPASRVCYQRSNPSLSCNPSTCESGQSCDCVCSGETDGPNVVDFMKYNGRSFSNVDQLNEIENDSFWGGTLQARTSTYSQNSGQVDSEGFVVATHDPSNYVLRNNSLSFELGSELFGTEYFVDLCWKNTNEDYAGEFEITPKYSYKNKQLFGQSYVETADILTRTDVECTDDKNKKFNLFDESWLLFPSQMSEILPQVGTVDGVSFCRVRHYFKENSNSFRPWDTKAIEVSTSLEVTLTEDQETPLDQGVKLCHPIASVPGNTNGMTNSHGSRGGNGNGNGNGNGSHDPGLLVCQVLFESNLAYEQFVLDHQDSSHGNSNSSYSVNHNDDSRFTSTRNCEETTGLTMADPVTCMLKFATDGYHHDHDFVIGGNGTLIIKENN
ncbi:hypothetical protein BIY24_10195 [Halobacteriovorax marinus]|uniref:hypothetical protein n=1 Tax=Halobacteriovorax marinus TaxID=97084 RepID=UPI000BC2EAA2|nr:hypothetical protein [Halobacteriovorax marinus]ATH08304.1 hypothetical protein BIY24_10195 [Halobacteriovorax marinus]